MRITSSEHKALARPVTTSGAIQYKPLRRSSFNIGRPQAQEELSPPKTREEALAATMRSLQANSHRPSTSPSILNRPSSAAADYAREYNVHREAHQLTPRPVSGAALDDSPSRELNSPARERPMSRLGKLADVAEDSEVLVSPRHCKTHDKTVLTVAGPTTPKIQVQPARAALQLDVDISTSSVFSTSPFDPRRSQQTTSSELELLSKYRGPERAATAPISPNRKGKSARREGDGRQAKPQPSSQPRPAQSANQPTTHCTTWNAWPSGPRRLSVSAPVLACANNSLRRGSQEGDVGRPYGPLHDGHTRPGGLPPASHPALAAPRWWNGDAEWPRRAINELAHKRDQ